MAAQRQLSKRAYRHAIPCTWSSNARGRPRRRSSRCLPVGAEELASFDNLNQAIDFAESIVLQQRAMGSPVELVDPPYGLVGAG